jgi:hypothetical protein
MSAVVWRKEDVMAIESGREQVNELAHSAKDAAEQTIGRQKDAVASSLGSFAGALRNAARNSGADEGRGVGPVAEWAADGLDRVSSTLRTRDLNSMLRGAEDFARRQPLAFFLTAAAAGFLAARFLKAGMESTDVQLDQSDMPADDDSMSTFSDASPMAPM